MADVTNDPVFNEGVNPRRLPVPVPGDFDTTYRDTPDDKPRALYVKDHTDEYKPLREFYGHTEVYVNTHLVDQASGGPEEGGWWYTYGVPSSSIRTTADQAAKIYAQEMQTAERENADRRSDIGSVLSEGRYEVTLETRYGAIFPQERPRYE